MRNARLDEAQVRIKIAKRNINILRYSIPGQEDTLEKEMATHSSVLAWRIPGMAEPGGLLSMGHTESDTTEVT